MNAGDNACWNDGPFKVATIAKQNYRVETRNAPSEYGWLLREDEQRVVPINSELLPGIVELLNRLPKEKSDKMWLEYVGHRKVEILEA